MTDILCIEESIDSGNTSLLSQSYARGIKRISGKFDETQDEFALAEEIVEARKKSWEELFEKFAKATDTTELDYRTLRPVEESDESEVPVRIPVRKSSAQIQHWVDTGNAPCLVLELKGSDDESISISESEAEDPAQDQSSASRSMIAALKPMDTSHERRVESGSSLSSVDTAAYIRSSANSTRGEKRPRNSELGRLDNSKVARSMNAEWPKVLVDRLPEPVQKGKKDVENGEKSQDIEKEVSRGSSGPKKRKLYTGTQSLVDLDADNPPVESSTKTKIHRKSIHPAMDSPSTFRQRKTMSFGPRLLTATWRQSRINSITKRRITKRSTLFRPKTPITTRRSLRRTVNARRSETKTETAALAQNKKSSTKEETKPNPSSKPQTSLSVRSDDASQIMREDLESRAKRIDEDSRSLEVGSIFKLRSDSCEETSENRKQSMEHAKKNLYRTLLRFSDNFECPLTSESNLRERIESLKKSAQPRIILHDFLDLRECCGKLERDNNKYWLRRREPNWISNEEEEKSGPETLKEKMRSERKPKSSERRRKKIYKTRFDSATDSSNASEKPQISEIVGRNDTRAEMRSEKVKFSNTMCYQSFIIQSCSEDEDIFELLTSIKPKSGSRKRSDETMKTTNTLRMVSSSSEAEEKPVEQTKKKRKTGKEGVRWSKRKSSPRIATVPESKQIQRQYSNKSETSVESSGDPMASESAEAAHTVIIASSSKKKAEKVDETQKSTIKDAGRSKRRNTRRILSGSESSDIFEPLGKKLPSRSSKETGKPEVLGEQNSFFKVATVSESKQIQSQGLNESGSSMESFHGPTASKSTEAVHTESVASSSSKNDQKGAEKEDETQKSTREDTGRSKKMNSVKTATGSEISKRFQPFKKKLLTLSRSSRNERHPETVNEQSRSLEISSEKIKDVRELLLSEAEVNEQNLKDRGSRDSKLNKKSKNSEINEDNDEKENRRGVNGSARKKKSYVEKIKDSSESDDDGRTNSSKVVEKATCNRLSTLLRYFSDESSIGDDTVIFSQKNYAGSNSITKDKSERTINSRGLKSLKKRSRKPRLTSTVVYRTKEFWETDSDHL